MTRRILSLWFPRLASERVSRRSGGEGAFALTLRHGNAEHLHCLNAAAEAAGLWRGMGLADARAACPALVTRAADLAGEAAFLGQLLRWAGRYAPRVAREGSDGLLADLTGAAHLFGGEAAVAADACARLARAGVSAVAGVADTPGAARALARFRPGGGIAAPGRGLEAIGALPVAALRIDSETAGSLARLGLDSIGALAAAPRAPLGRRFGPGLLARLDQVLGAVPEPLAAEPPPPVLATRLTLPEPVGRIEDVEAGLARLLDPLCAILTRHGLGARRLRLELRRADAGAASVEVGLARPLRDPARIRPLFGPGLERVEAGDGIDRLRLVATLAEPLGPAQLATPVRGGEERGEGRLADLVSRLGNRLGFERIEAFAPAESHIPERSFLRLPAGHAGPPADAAAGWTSGRPRPLLVFPPEPMREAAPGRRPPARFRWRRMRLTTARATGPERIAPEWWLDDPAWRSGPRDYWKLETGEGRRVWAFHTPRDPGWFVQGEFP